LRMPVVSSYTSFAEEVYKTVCLTSQKSADWTHPHLNSSLNQRNSSKLMWIGTCIAFQLNWVLTMCELLHKIGERKWGSWARCRACLQWIYN
jgi:hypothetical protein